MSKGIEGLTDALNNIIKLAEENDHKFNSTYVNRIHEESYQAKMKLQKTEDLSKKFLEDFQAVKSQREEAIVQAKNISKPYQDVLVACSICFTLMIAFYAIFSFISEVRWTGFLVILTLFNITLIANSFVPKIIEIRLLKKIPLFNYTEYYKNRDEFDYSFVYNYCMLKEKELVDQRAKNNKLVDLCRRLKKLSVAENIINDSYVIMRLSDNKFYAKESDNCWTPSFKKARIWNSYKMAKMYANATCKDTKVIIFKLTTTMSNKRKIKW